MRRMLPPETRSKRTGYWGQIRTFLHLDLEDLALLMFGIRYLLLLWLLWFVVVCGGAVDICCSHVDVTGVFAQEGLGADGVEDEWACELSTAHYTAPNAIPPWHLVYLITKGHNSRR